MQKLFTLLIVLFLLSSPLHELMAQAPQKMSFQAILRNSSNNLLVNTTVGMRISVLEASETGNAVYVETHSVKTNANGLATLVIGTGSVTKGIFADIPWGKNSYYIRTETDPAGGSNYTITSTAQLMSVPYALYAANSGTGNNGKSAFEVWRDIVGNEQKTVNDFLASIKGETGKSAFDAWKSYPGNEQKTIEQFLQAMKGETGKSAYEIWKSIAGNEQKSMEEYLLAMKGEKGTNGKSAFDIWKEQPGNEEKLIGDFLSSITTVAGKSAFEIWKEQAGNQSKTMNDYLQYIKGETGKSAFDLWKAQAGNESKTEADYWMAMKGKDGLSAFESWKQMPGNENKTQADYLTAMKGANGKSAFEIWKEMSGNETKTEADYQAALKGANGKSAFELWKEIPGNETKTEADYLAALKGANGKSTFELWKEIPGNETKTEADFQAALKGANGKSAFELWKEIPGNETKTEADFQAALKGANGKSAFELWKEIQGNETKTEADYQASLKGANGKSAFEIWKEIPGNETKTEADYLAALKGANGKSAFEIWKEIPGNETKTEADYLAALKGANGKSAFELWKEIAGNETKTEADYQASLKGANGKSAFELWKEIPGNEDKTEADYQAALKGANGKSAFELWKEIPGNEDKTEADYQTAMRGRDGKSAFDLWKEIPGNEDKTEADYQNAMKGKGIDFRGSFDTIDDYIAAGNEVSLNKAYYNKTDKKSYLYDGATWQVFAQDGSGGSGGSMGFNVDRPITRQGLSVTGMNLGRGKTVEEFIEAFFFPALAATPPQTTFTTTTSSFPYSVWKNWPSLTRSIDLNWSITNVSKTDATDDKDITSIRLLDGSTEVTTAVPNNSSTSQNGTFSSINLVHPTGTPTSDYSKTYTLEVKDAQPNTVNKTLTLTLQKAIQLSYGAPSLSPSTLVYEYSPNDIPLSLNWNISRGDETITVIRVAGNTIASTSNTGTENVVFKSPANGGAITQNFSFAANGNIFGWAGTQNTSTVRWESTLYRGAVSLAGVSPCDAGFNFTDAQVKALPSKQLGGTWKGDAGFDFVCDAAGQYIAFAYPDDAATPTVQYFDANFNVWQTYPANQVKIINRTGFVNASGYNGINYKIVFVCVEYKSATVKIRIK